MIWGTKWGSEESIDPRNPRGVPWHITQSLTRLVIH